MSAASRRVQAAVVIVLVAAPAIATAWLVHPPDEVRAAVAQDGLDHPWDIAFADDGRMLVTERILAALDSGEPKPPTDLEGTDALLRRITAGEDEASAYREVLLLRTFTLASMNPRFWPLAEAFARELLIHDELSAAQVAAVVAEVNGETPDAVAISA